MKKLTIIHTTVATVLSMPSMIQKMYPDQFEIVNVLDDSMLNEIKANGLNKRAEISEVNDEIDKLNTVFNSMMD